MNLVTTTDSTTNTSTSQSVGGYNLEGDADKVVITIKDAGPTPMVPVVAPGGKIAYTSVNKTESIVKLDLATGETLARVDLSTPEERVKTLFGLALSPDAKTLAAYQTPVRLLPKRQR